MHRHRRAPASGRLTPTSARSTIETVRFSVRLTPNAGSDRVDGVVDGVLRARVSARAVEGAANEALTRLLAASLGVARGRVAIVRGTTSRTKVVEVEAVDAAHVRSIWPGIAL